MVFIDLAGNEPDWNTVVDAALKDETLLTPSANVCFKNIELICDTFFFFNFKIKKEVDELTFFKNEKSIQIK